MCNKAVNTCLIVFDSIHDRYITHKFCDKVVSEDPFMLKYFPEKYKTQEMCEKAVDCFLAFKFVPDWLVKNKMIEKLQSAIFFYEYIIFGDLDSDFIEQCNP